MIKIIRNPKLSKAEIKVLERKLEKIKEDIDYYSDELKILKKQGNQFQINRTNNKLKMLNADLLNLIELLS